MSQLMKKIKRLSRLRAVPAALGAIAFGTLLISQPQITADGVRGGLELCGSCVIPSLFPFMVLCSFLVKSGMCGALGRVLGKAVHCLFRLPGSASGAIIMSLIGGYPVGMRMTSQLLRRGEISGSDAYRMTLFCVNAGPAFVIGTVGASMLGNPLTGALIFASLSLASVTVGLLSRFVVTEGAAVTVSESVKEKCSIQRSVAEAVGETSSAMLSVCAWIILFACVCSSLSLLPDRMKSAELTVRSLLEVTTGCELAVRSGISVPVIAAILGWSGVSVQCQVLNDVRETGMQISVFVVSRIVNGSLAAMYCCGLMYFFPDTATVFLNSASSAAEMYVNSAPVSAGLMIMSALLILDTSQIFSESAVKNRR